MCLLLLMAVGAVCAGLLFPRTVTVEQYQYSSDFWNVNSTSLSDTEDIRITMCIKVGGVRGGVWDGASLVNC